MAFELDRSRVVFIGCDVRDHIPNPKYTFLDEERDFTPLVNNTVMSSVDDLSFVNTRNRRKANVKILGNRGGRGSTLIEEVRRDRFLTVGTNHCVFGETIWFFNFSEEPVTLLDSKGNKSRYEPILFNRLGFDELDYVFYISTTITINHCTSKEEVLSYLLAESEKLTRHPDVDVRRKGEMYLKVYKEVERWRFDTDFRFDYISIVKELAITKHQGNEIRKKSAHLVSELQVDLEFTDNMDTNYIPASRDVANVSKEEFEQLSKFKLRTVAIIDPERRIGDRYTYNMGVSVKIPVIEMIGLDPGLYVIELNEGDVNVIEKYGLGEVDTSGLAYRSREEAEIGMSKSSITEKMYTEQSEALRLAKVENERLLVERKLQAEVSKMDKEGEHLQIKKDLELKSLQEDIRMASYKQMHDFDKMSYDRSSLRMKHEYEKERNREEETIMKYKYALALLGLAGAAYVVYKKFL